MLIPLPEALSLAAQCAPGVAPETMMAIIEVESRFDPLAIGVNGRPRATITASSPREAAGKASALIAAGRSVDLGLAQINSGNLAWLDLSVEAAFDPCRNLAAAARVLQDGYARSDATAVGEQPALQTALSYYNTGHPRRGFDNGYVARVTRAAARFMPGIPGSRASVPRTPMAAPQPRPIPPAWDVFGQLEAGPGFVIRASARIPGESQ